MFEKIAVVLFVACVGTMAGDVQNVSALADQTPSGVVCVMQGEQLVCDDGTICEWQDGIWVCW